MNRHRWVVVGLAVIAAAVAYAVWRPWPAPTPSSSDPAAAPKPAIISDGKTVNLVIVKSAGGPCMVTVTGSHGDSRPSWTARLQAGDDQSLLMIPGPYSIDAVTVERAGKTRRHELKITIPGGETREVRVNEDDTVVVAPPQ
jgi:hypothetical protein